jgi:hypothetical protein
MKKFLQFLSRYWPFVIILLVVSIFFYPVFLNRLAPIPGDFVVGTYFPWLDYKWGYTVGVPVKNAVTSDVVSIIYPLRSYAVDVLKSGHLPLWNPFMFGGTPILADFQVAILSPTIFTYFLLPKIWAWTAQVMLQPTLAAIFCYLLLRNFGLRKTESLFGGIFFAFSSFNIIWMEWNTNTLTAAFIPLVILFLDKFIKSGKMFWGVLLSAAICLQILSGYPQIVIFTIILLVVFVLFRIDHVSKVKGFYIILFTVLGVLLSSVISIPGAELILNSQRKYEVLSQDLIYLPWQNLITILAPDYFGNPATYNYFGVGNYTINTAYSGVAVLCLSIAGVLNYWKRREVKFLVTVFMLSLLFALPTPLANALFNSPIPGISVSSNTRILVFADLALALLAGFGIFSLLKRERPRGVVFLFAPLITLIGISVYTYFLGVNRGVSIRNLILPIGLSILVPALILLRGLIYSKNLLRNVLVFILCLIAVGELFRYGWKFTPFSSPDFVFPSTPVLDYLDQEDGLFRVSMGNMIPMNMWVPYGLQSLSGYDASYSVWWARFFNAIRGQDPNNPRFSYYADFDQYFSPWFDILNNKYLLVLDPSQAHDVSNPNLFYHVEQSQKFEKVFQDKSSVVYQNKNVFPRALFMSDWEYVPDNQALAILADVNFPVKSKIIIDKPADIVKDGVAESTVAYEFYSSDKSVINVSTNKAGFLFITDAWYPGWIAKIDGIKVPLYRADYVFRAVQITAGEHVVEFDFLPFSLKLGKILSLSSLLLLVFILISHRRLDRWANNS